MASVNKVIILGHLGADPEVRYTSSGTKVVSLRVATTDVVGTGETREERTEWHRITVWGKTADHCGNYLKKGRLVYIEGRLQTRSYDDKDGIKRYSTDIVANTVKFLGAGERSEGGRPPERSERQDSPGRPASMDEPATPFDEPKAPEDDFPF